MFLPAYCNLVCCLHDTLAMALQVIGSDYVIYIFFAIMQEVPENKRRVSLLRGIVIARRNAGIATTFRIRRVIAGVGVEMVFPL